MNADILWMNSAESRDDSAGVRSDGVNQRSGRNSFGPGEKFLASRCSVYVCTRVLVPSGMKLQNDISNLQPGGIGGSMTD